MSRIAIRILLAVVILFGIADSAFAVPPASHRFLPRPLYGPEEGITITKELSALERPAGTDNTSFNPYALQYNDKIQVTVTIKGLTVSRPLIVSDNLLAVNGIACSPNGYGGGTYLSGPPRIEWTTATTFTEMSFSFPCTMSNSALASNESKLPEVLVGETKVYYNNKVYYGGLTGKEVVYNYSSSGQSGTGYEPFGFDLTPLETCITGIVSGALPTSMCYTRNSLNITVASGRTYASTAYLAETPLTETAVLFYPSRTTITGDAFMGGSDLNNFAFWGKSLATSRGSASGSDAFWSIGGYSTKNANSRASMDPNGTEYKQYKDRIAQLLGEAKTADTANSIWALQHQSLNPATSDEASIYPQGKIWKVEGNLFIDDSKTYSGLGTIIVTGNLYLNVNILPLNETSRLGFIVTGRVIVGGKCTIKAPIISTSTVDPGFMVTLNASNSTLIGSFVAPYFDFDGENLRFFYDYDLDSAWPPGFGYFKMPNAKE